MLDKEDLIYLRSRSIDEIPYTELKELTDSNVDSNLSIEERIDKFFSYIENPYCFLVKGVPVQLSFNPDSDSIEDLFIRYVISKKDK